MTELVGHRPDLLVIFEYSQVKNSTNCSFPIQGVRL